MGGGDLNTKKSWHPNTMKNQERVWKAEQQEAAEKRRLNELRREIDEERNREELKTMAKKSGVLPSEDGDDKKLEWMYRGPSQLVNREEYLLGRAIDKTFEDLDAQEKGSSSAFGVAQPKNHVEHECIPFSIRQHKDVLSNDQVDLARKLMEDPLMLIKQKEIESRQKILQNPVKLKELHRLLKGDQSLRERRASESKKSKKKDKKSKKSKKSHKKKRSKGKRHSGSSEAGSDSDGSVDLDKLLVEKYKKVAGEHQEGVNIDRLLTMKYEKLSKELDMMGSDGTKKKQQRRERSSSESDYSDVDQRKRDDNRRRRREETKRDDRKRRSKERDRSSNKERLKDEKKSRGDSFSEENAHNRTRDRKPSNSVRARSRSRSAERYRNKSPKRTNNRSPGRREQPTKGRHVRDRSRTRSVEKRTHARESNKRRSRSRSPRRRSPAKAEQSKRLEKTRRTPSSSSSASSSDSDTRQPQRQLDSDEERRARKVRNFGLVTASGEKLDTKAQPDVRLYRREEIRAEQSKQRPSWSKPTERKRPLTEQELEEKRLAMMSNAQWREKERESNVKRYEAEDHREESKQSGDYDKEFLTKQFKRAAASETVESRIRSNRNNIQRSNGAMDRNFVKR